MFELLPDINVSLDILFIYFTFIVFLSIPVHDGVRDPLKWVSPTVIVSGILN